MEDETSALAPGGGGQQNRVHGGTPPTDSSMEGELKGDRDVHAVCLHDFSEHQPTPIAMVTIEMNDPNTNSPKITLMDANQMDAVNGVV